MRLTEILRNKSAQLYRSLLFELQLLLDRLKRTSTIVEVNVELVNYCNLRCKWCALDHRMKKQAMSKETLHKALKDLLFDKRFKSVKRLLFWSAGETLLHPDVLGMFDVVKTYKDSFAAAGKFFPEVRLLTNATALNPQLSKGLVDSGVVDSIRFSVDGGSREKYEEIRSGARWEAVRENIGHFVRINQGKIKTGIICIIEFGKEQNTNWMTEEFQTLCKSVDEVELRYPHDWIGNIEVNGLKKKFNNWCYFLNHSMVLLPDGDVTVCCNDLNGKGAIGNLNNKTLFEIYSSRRRKRMIFDFKHGRRETIELCRNCGGV
ncbi:MAG: SPASM domain-containing protein [Verrucomicrobia bacterium]|nr:SPASM domain-containing protein [Verrucomicrobiota bacterium]